MLCPDIFVDKLLDLGISHYAGVPCSYLTPLIITAEQREDISYVNASSEGEALCIASGVWLGNEPSVVMCQNSGLGNMVNPLTSLCLPSEIPVLLIVSWRGKPGKKDEPQHEMMGAITTQLLSLMSIPWAILSKDADLLESVLKNAISTMLEKKRPFALIVEEGTFLPSLKYKKTTIGKTTLSSRMGALEVLSQHIPDDTPVIATTGKTGRELYALADKSNHFYCVGAMGFANAIAHGLSLATSNKVFVIDGDGAVLMHLGNLATVGRQQNKLVHIILDNNCYDSTGGQETASNSVDFVAIAYACGYKKCISVSSLTDFAKVLALLKDCELPALINLSIRPGSTKNLGRPSVSPAQVARRLKKFIKV